MPSECYIARKSKGDEFISKFSGPSPLLDFSLNQDRIARLAVTLLLSLTISTLFSGVF